MMMTKGKSDATEVDIDNQLLAHMKIPGITLDKELNFSDHGPNIRKNTSKRIRFFTRPRKLIFTTIKLHIYKATFIQYFNDGSLAWHFWKTSDRNKLERMNERGLRAVFCDWNSTYGQLLMKSNLTASYNTRLEYSIFHLMKIFLPLHS